MQLTFQVSWTLLTSIVLETELQISWAELELSFSERALSSAQLSKILPQLSSGNFFQNLQFCLKITKCGPREPRCKSNAVRRPVITLLFLNFKTLKMFIANGWSNKAALRVCFSSPVQQWLNHVSHFFCLSSLFLLYEKFSDSKTWITVSLKLFEILLQKVGQSFIEQEFRSSKWRKKNYAFKNPRRSEIDLGTHDRSDNAWAD